MRSGGESWEGKEGVRERIRKAAVRISRSMWEWYTAGEDGGKRKSETRNPKSESNSGGREGHNADPPSLFRGFLTVNLAFGLYNASALHRTL
jgi:hypothetical protein